MKITVQTKKLEVLTFDAESWSVDEPGYLWISDEHGTTVGTFAAGMWEHVTGEEAA